MKLFLPPVFYCIFLLLITTFVSAEVVIEDVTLPEVKSTKIVLTIKTPTGDKPYTIPMLESIGLKRLKTSTFWTEDDGVYEGVLLVDLLKHAKIEKSASIKIIALDEYMTAIPKEDWETWPILLATRRNGTPLTVRTKGPTRIIYPKDIGGALSRNEMRTKWIWTINTIIPNS